MIVISPSSPKIDIKQDRTKLENGCNLLSYRGCGQELVSGHWSEISWWPMTAVAPPWLCGQRQYLPLSGYDTYISVPAEPRIDNGKAEDCLSSLSSPLISQRWTTDRARQ
ncbi:hypothetical protein RRG08_014884 [Elysia crispata]|uniref:Uncharacterized protein n=1 Tax=Elysia crispata TaxID=231223 RepID=A0AAE1DI30_9GAST|nr:hypothetical protein RRG08_014884 [Elysia crispata]